MPPPEENVPAPENPAPPPGDNLPSGDNVPPGNNPPPHDNLPSGDHLLPPETGAPPSDHHAPLSEYDLPPSESQTPPPQSSLPPPETQTPPPQSGLPPPGYPGWTCPNCHQPYEPGRQFCPHCGFHLNPVPQPKFVAGSAVVDVILALLLCVLCAPLVATAIIPLIVYFATQKQYVAFRKGLLAGLILYAVIILGALAFCGWFFIALTAGEHH